MYYAFTWVFVIISKLIHNRLTNSAFYHFNSTNSISNFNFKLNNFNTYMNHFVCFVFVLRQHLQPKQVLADLLQVV